MTAGNSCRLQFENFIQNAAYPCVGARSALASEGIQIVEATDLRAASDDAIVLDALQNFSPDNGSFRALKSLAIVFPATPALTELQFEEYLWARLSALHERDKTRFAWDESVSADPRSPEFGMSFGGRAFYIIGMHPGSSRASRRSPCAALVFNPHSQFDNLRAAGLYQRFKEVIRARDIALQGTTNPMLADRGERSEAVQYSGRQSEGVWTCPFSRLN